MPSPLVTLADRWATARPAERANAQSYVIELCRALDVDPPAPAGSGYEFEYAIKVVARDGTEATNFVDCYKARHFALEAKDQEPGGSDDRLLRRAFGQVRNYVGHLPDDRPPYLLVLDVGRTLVVWDRWSGDYGGYGAGRRIDLRTLAERPEDVDLLRDIWTNPAARDPRGHATIDSGSTRSGSPDAHFDLSRVPLDASDAQFYLPDSLFESSGPDIEARGTRRDAPDACCDPPGVRCGSLHGHFGSPDADFDCSGDHFDCSGDRLDCSGDRFDSSGGHFDSSGEHFDCSGGHFDCSGGHFDCSGGAFDGPGVVFHVRDGHLDPSRSQFDSRYLLCDALGVRDSTRDDRFDAPDVRCDVPEG